MRDARNARSAARSPRSATSCPVASTMPDREFESRILHFERVWRLQGPPEIHDFLGGPFASASPRRGRLLVELICVDLEYRWRQPGGAGPTTLGDYVERFPELVALDRLPV